MTNEDITKVHELIGNMFEAAGIDVAQLSEDMSHEATCDFDGYVDELNTLLRATT